MLEVNNIFKMCESDNFSRLCRICTAEGAKTGIYGDEGVKNKLEAKIKNYLHIEVSKEDLLPKVICTKCSTKIEDHHSFASLALQMQVKLYSMVKIKGRDIVSSSNGQKYDESDEEAEEEEEEEEENEEDEEAIDNQEDEDEEEEEEDDYEQTGETSESGFSGSLLHSILTNGRQSHTREQTGSGAEVMEVEVSLDPMLFLSGQDDNGEDGEESSPGTAHSSRNEYSSNGSDREVKDSKPYNCSICPRGFNTEISLQSHLWSHLSRKVLTNTDLNARLRNHRRGSVYSSNGVLHTIEEAPLGQPYLCPVCGKQISTKGNLKVHLETHRPKGKYACDICGRIFKTQSNLYRHKEYHGGDQYTCEVCSRVYPTKSTLRAHSITHSDLRPHQCPLCDKTFKRNQDLKFHINQHTGARPYKCPFCPKAFASSGNCFSHRKRMHPSEQQKYKANGYVQ